MEPYLAMTERDFDFAIRKPKLNCFYPLIAGDYPFRISENTMSND